MAAVVELAIPPRPDFLALARMVVGAAAATEPLFPDERIDDLRLAVSEACTNAIEAQVAAGPGPGSVVLRCEVDADRVVIEIVDHGGGFDPEDLTAHPPVTDPRRLDYDRGLGIPLIRALTDDLEYRTSAAGTVVRMVLRAAGGEAFAAD